MTINANEYKSSIGLRDLYIATVTQDDSSAYVSGTPVYLAPASEATQEPASSMETQYADDAPFDVMLSEGETKINLSVTALPVETIATLLGKVYDTVSGRMFDNNATPPYFALGFRSLKSTGGYRYYWYLKGKFDPPKEATGTRKAAPEPKLATLVYTAIHTTHEFDLGDINGTVKRVVGDTDADNFSATGWFTQVQTPAAVAPSALALSSSTPTDGGSGISVSADQTLTFNNALTADAIRNVVLVKADGTVVAATMTLDATAKILTINPTSNLDASSTYLITYGVTDIYGQYLQGAINFETA